MAYQTAGNIFTETLSQIKNEGLYKEEKILCSPQASFVQVCEPMNQKKLLNLCSNNYLGLSSHPEIIKAAHSGLEQRGYGMSSVRFICGTQDIHQELECKISEFLGLEDTCLFASCFDANGALFEALLCEKDAIFSDQLVHASLIDGMRLCKAERNIFKHQDISDLEKKIKNSKARIKMIVTDGVFSMDGDMAQLDQICDIAAKYEALVVVDDSHATGFIGKTGRGTHEQCEVMDQVDILTTTFGKALGGATGGCISGHKEIIALLKQRGRPYLFSNALMPAVVVATLKALELLTASTARRDRLEELSKFWRHSLTDAGFDLKPGNTPIVPLMLYDAKLAQQFSQALYEEGLLAIGFYYPVVPKGEARIRTQISASLERAQLEQALQVFIKVKQRLGV